MDAGCPLCRPGTETALPAMLSGSKEARPEPVLCVLVQPVIPTAPATCSLWSGGLVGGLRPSACQGLRTACAHRSLRVGLQISLDYWWCANVVLRGVEEVCPRVLVTVGGGPGEGDRPDGGRCWGH